MEVLKTELFLPCHTSSLGTCYLSLPGETSGSELCHKSVSLSDICFSSLLIGIQQRALLDPQANELFSKHLSEEETSHPSVTHGGD